jgi:hypothetical protein
MAPPGGLWGVWWTPCEVAHQLSERISPGLILLHRNVTILAKIIGEVVPILTSVDYITFHNSVMIVTEIVECLLLSHLRRFESVCDVLGCSPLHFLKIPDLGGPVGVWWTLRQLAQFLFA